MECFACTEPKRCGKNIQGFKLVSCHPTPQVEQAWSGPMPKPSCQVPRDQLWSGPRGSLDVQFLLRALPARSPSSLNSPSPQLHRGDGLLQVPDPRHQGWLLGQRGQRTAWEPAATWCGPEPSAQAGRDTAGLSAAAGRGGRQPARTGTTPRASMLGGRQPGDARSTGRSARPGPAGGQQALAAVGPRLPGAPLVARRP